MRQLFLIFVFFITCSTILYGQDNILISSKQVSNTEKINEILRKNEAYISVDLVEINLDKLLEYEEFTLQLYERNIPIKKDRIETKGINNFIFVGGNNDGDHILMSVLGNDIQGVIETRNNDVFTIETVGERQYALITVDNCMLLEACCSLKGKKAHSSVENVNRNAYDSHVENGLGIASSHNLNVASENDCKIRVLVLYTPSAKLSVSNIKNTIQTAVALTNQAFTYSQIDYQIELVYAGQTDYIESDFETDLCRFRVANDGFMDEVHTLRNKYSADICVLLINDVNYCGLATDVGVAEYDAFCAVSSSSSCMISNYSFAHEIGHLLGCRHDNDYGTTPFPYGHGYISPSHAWRTIMAYNISGMSIPRLSYWSNPNILHNGEPMGTVAVNDNARVWNERSNTVIRFRQPDNNIIFTDSDIPNTLYADVIAKQNITTNGIVNIKSGNTINMRAGNSIFLQPGFSVQLNAEFSAKIENVDDCEECTTSFSHILVQNVPEEDDIEHIKNKNALSFSYTVTPDSSDKFINIKYFLETEMPFSIELVNLFGQKIQTILSKQHEPAGNYTLQIPVCDIPEGTYFLTISSNDQKITKKIIINK